MKILDSEFGLIASMILILIVSIEVGWLLKKGMFFIYQKSRATKITLVMDNFKTHVASAFYGTFEPEEAKRIWDRFEFIYTPNMEVG